MATHVSPYKCLATFLLASTCFITIFSPLECSESQTVASPHPKVGKHFDQVLIIVLENQSYASAMSDPFLAELAAKGASFPKFRNLTHPSYPNYLAMIAGATFNTEGSDSQKNFLDDREHRTIADQLDWRNYAENYPGNRKAPYLGAKGAKYGRKHVPFLSFVKIQKEGFDHVVSVDTTTGNPLVTDISNFRKDPGTHPLPQYMFYSPNLDDDGHDPYFQPKVGLKKGSTWLRHFLEDWLAFDNTTWAPSDDKMDRLLVIVTYDESEGRGQNYIYTVFLGRMVKNQQVAGEYNHYSVLRTIEDNFDLSPLHQESGDGKASLITEVWK